MAISSYKAEQRERHCGCQPDECVETSYNTQKAINKERIKYCDAVYVAAGEVNKWEKSYAGETNIYKRRKCMFRWTEKNFQRYRNTEITLGTELMQTTEIIRGNVAEYTKWGTDLSASLKNIFKAVKDSKAKIGELRKAADDLHHSKTDTVYDTEWTILTGKSPSKCGEPGNEPPNDYPEKCRDIDKTVSELICMPSALDKDINSIFKSSSEIIGIQVFSNLSRVDTLQKNLAEKAKAFDGYLQEVIKARDGDMKKMQEALVKSVQETTKAAGSLYTARSSFEGIFDSTRYFCCPKCGCVSTVDDNCKPRLADCECEICKICGQVKNTFCNEGNGHQDSVADD